MKFSLALALLLARESAQAFTSQHVRQSPALVAKRNPTAVWGILDEIESDSYDLMSSSDEQEVNMSDAYEMFLAELVFSANDPRVDIMNKLDLAGDPAFIEWLETKGANSKDPEERIALRDLHAMIMDVKTRIEVNKLAEERAAKEAGDAEAARVAQAEVDADAGRAMSTADVLRKAAQIDNAEMGEIAKNSEKKKTFYEEEITPEIRLSYETILNSVLPPYKAGETAAQVVYNNYEQFDAQLVKLLNERADNGDQDSKDVLMALASEQQSRIGAATEALKEVLSQGEPMRMEGALVKMAREGKIDEPFLLLLQANEDQARAAGAEGPAQLMGKLRKRAMEEKDKQSTSKEIKLIRQLLRTEDSAEREKLFEDAFTPKAGLLVPGTAENAQKAVDGEAPEQEQPLPDVPPPDFINACKAVLLNFGNLGTDDADNGDLASRIKKLASEAEVVATRIYGKPMSLQEQQDRAWKEQTTSIFDLERMEIEAERMGEQAPWANPNADDEMLVPGFGLDGKMQIGGS
eukprot:CAMPEP_0172471424 /NCGR_PEP_ID=MMETSP1065-20121228/67803_1 /TAXON_ID=265537 /ORGANISM="Amphiprora paludosa, Strain CCMP125" /LENGTH=520 /DNA_ID=CAMNT_0013229519 /DNA_START=41 /DNA_END=1606 /DNA_ORIENTATION=+